VAPLVIVSSNRRRPEPSPPTNLVTHDTTSTGTVAAGVSEVPVEINRVDIGRT
jgi:hypothetical protein